MRSFLSGTSEQFQIPIALREYDSDLSSEVDPTLYVAQLQNRDLNCSIHFEQYGTSAITSCYGPWKPKFRLSQTVANAAKVNVTLRVLALSDSKVIERIQTLEEKISQILTKVVQGKEYPGCYIDLNVCINTIGRKVSKPSKLFSVLFNSCIFCLSRGGIALTTTCLAAQDDHMLIVADVVSEREGLYYLQSEGEHQKTTGELVEEVLKSGTLERLSQFVVS